MQRLILTLLVAAMLAGCSEAPPAPIEDDATFDDVPVEVSDTTGAIRGVVVDGAVAPVIGATVTLTGSGQAVETNANGAFVFSKLDPGTYFLRAEKAGFISVQQSATVVAGEKTPPVVKILLERDPASIPEVVVLQWDGFIQCGLSVIALCGVPVVNDAVGDEFLTVFELDRPGVEYLQSEMIWETTQAISPNMQLWQQATGDGGCTFDAQNAPSPNVINTTFGDYNVHGSRACFETLGNTTDLYLRVFSGSIDGTFPPTEDGCYPVVRLCMGVGATIQQEFVVFNHLFYGFKPPEGWQFSIDGDVKPPQ